MRRVIVYFTLVICFYSLSCKNVQKQNGAISISNVEMHLSAYGVESDDFPSIDAYIDLAHNSSSCKKWYYNPAYKASSYTLSNEEMKKILGLLKNSDLGNLKKEYRVRKTDQPTSTIIIFAAHKTFVIKDYGLEGDHPLPELYSIVYKL